MRGLVAAAQLAAISRHLPHGAGFLLTIFGLMGKSIGKQNEGARRRKQEIDPGE